MHAPGSPAPIQRFTRGQPAERHDRVLEPGHRGRDPGDVQAAGEAGAVQTDPATNLDRFTLTATLVGTQKEDANGKPANDNL